MEPAHMKWFE